jgi:hypothetical protein
MQRSSGALSDALPTSAVADVAVSVVDADGRRKFKHNGSDVARKMPATIYNVCQTPAINRPSIAQCVTGSRSVGATHTVDGVK